MSLDRKEIDTNTPALIQHIWENYDPNRPPTIVEPIQNSQDEFANKLKAGNIEEGRTLRIKFHVNVDEEYAEITDNAGGMSREIMADVVPEIDTTSPHKASGGNVGSEGRGLFAVAGGSQKMYIETLNTDGERLATIIYPEEGDTLEQPEHPNDIASDPEEDIIQDAPQLRAPEGTLLKLTGLKPQTLETLSDWDEVERVLRELFTPLFSRDDVELIYTIEEDGTVEQHTPDVPQIDDLIEEKLFRKDEHTFTAAGEEHVLKNVVFGRASGSYPWDGIAFFKGNEDFDGPVMMVDDYGTEVASLTGSDPEMIAWCRIDECPGIEDPSHQKLTIRKQKTRLRELAQQVHADHFAEESAAEEQEINRLLRDTVNEAVNELNEEYFQDFANLDEHGTLQVRDTDGEDQLRGEDDGSLVTLNPEDYPEEIGDIDIEARVYPPETPEYDRYLVHNITVHSDELGTPLKLDAVEIEAVPNEIQTETMTWTAPDAGWYRITAEIAGIPTEEDADAWTPSDDDVIDDTMLMLPIGIDPRGEQPPEAGGDGGSGPGEGTDGEDRTTEQTATIFSEMNELTNPDSYIFADAILDSGSGFTVNLNKGHSKWREIYETANRDHERIEQHQEFGSKKIARAVVEELKYVKMSNAADNIASVDELIEESLAIRRDHEEIYGELENNVERIVEEGLIE